MEFTYKGLSGQLSRHTVTGEEVDRNLQRLLQQNPRIAVITDRPTQSGDEVVLDYAGFCDGEQFAGGTAQNQTLVLGSGMLSPALRSSFWIRLWKNLLRSPLPSPKPITPKT